MASHAGLASSPCDAAAVSDHARSRSATCRCGPRGVPEGLDVGPIPVVPEVQRAAATGRRLLVLRADVELARRPLLRQEPEFGPRLARAVPKKVPERSRMDCTGMQFFASLCDGLQWPFLGFGREPPYRRWFCARPAGFMPTLAAGRHQGSRRRRRSPKLALRSTCGPGSSQVMDTLPASNFTKTLVRPSLQIQISTRGPSCGCRGQDSPVRPSTTTSSCCFSDRPGVWGGVNHRR